MLKEKHIEPIRITMLYETGLAEWFESNGLRFHWYSWLLCEVACHPGNPIHYVIMTNFYAQGMHNKIGIAENVEVTRWNPSYEDDCHHQNLKLSSLHYWKPVAIVSLGGSNKPMD